jgi:stearoyl-CoA desaturase (delta-9 desaturase)
MIRVITNPFWRFFFSVVGNASVQRGPLRWASHHRHHHRFTDQEQDVHSPQRHGFWWKIDMTYYPLVSMSCLGIVKDLRSVPELVLNENRIIANTLNQL